MGNNIQLSRHFTVERYSRAIDACEDVTQLRHLAKLLLGVWQQQVEATERYGAELLGRQHPEVRTSQTTQHTHHTEGW